MTWQVWWDQLPLGRYALFCLFTVCWAVVAVVCATAILRWATNLITWTVLETIDEYKNAEEEE